jgi:hypothetical protein
MASIFPQFHEKQKVKLVWKGVDTGNSAEKRTSTPASVVEKRGKNRSISKGQGHLPDLLYRTPVFVMFPIGQMDLGQFDSNPL